MTAIDLLPQAAEVTGDVVRQIPSGAWRRPSPCSAWAVREVLNHLTAEHLWAPRLLAGQTLAEVGDAYDGDMLGEDPVESWQRAVEASLAAWAGAGPQDRVHTSMGLIAAGEYAEQMLVDLVVHGWDLAAGAGLDYRPPVAAVERNLAYEGPRAGAGPIPGIFDAAVPTDSREPLDRLVALLGRDPAAWS